MIAKRTTKRFEPQLIALAIATGIAALVIAIHIAAQLHYGCSPGPKPIGWSTWTTLIGGCRLYSS